MSFNKIILVGADRDRELTRRTVPRFAALVWPQRETSRPLPARTTTDNLVSGHLGAGRRVASQYLTYWQPVSSKAGPSKNVPSERRHSLEKHDLKSLLPRVATMRGGDHHVKRQLHMRTRTNGSTDDVPF